MLHDPGSYSPPQRYTDIRLSRGEKEILRRLGHKGRNLARRQVVVA